jgi:hypothetical protein
MLEGGLCVLARAGGTLKRRAKAGRGALRAAAPQLPADARATNA